MLTLSRPWAHIATPNAADVQGHSMPDFAIVDTHLHLWDPVVLRYPWLDGVPALNRPFLLDDYRRACDGVAVEAMVFLQCEADVAAFEAEADWVAGQALMDPRIKALVPWAPLEKGRAVEADLRRLSRHGIVRGIRRIIQFEPDVDFCLRPLFVEGVRTLRDFDLAFDICIDHRHLANTIRFASQLPEVAMVLDHIGKPGIKAGLMEPWRDEIRTLAALPHVHCKISGVATEADHTAWTEADLRRYIDVAIDAFGFDRIMFGGDWPVATQATGLTQWVALLDRALAGVPATHCRKFWRDNAVSFYRLDL
jgi:L-fuconolactonase